MLCELCGKQVRSTRQVRVEGTIMATCADCARFGEPLAPAPARVAREPAHTGAQRIAARLEHRVKRSRPKDIIGELEKTTEALVEDFGSRIRIARSRKGWTQQELGQRINERWSIINKVETGDFRPDEALIRKLERALEIKLKERVQAVAVQKAGERRALTFADLVRMQQD